MEKQIQHLETVTDYCNFFGVVVQHPLVTAADFQEYGTYPAGRMQSNLYCIMYKELDCGEMKYGRSKNAYSLMGAPRMPQSPKDLFCLFIPI